MEDCGSAIKGPNRLDLYFNRHKDALVWGRQKGLKVRVVHDEWIDRQRLVPKPIRAAVKGVDRAIHAVFGG